MCLIIHSDKGFNSVDANLVKSIYSRNSDGFGLMYQGDDGLKVHKGIYTPDKISKIMDNLPDDRPVTVHFRLATSGAESTKQAHPFKVAYADGYELSIVHNGVLTRYEPDVKLGDDPEKSDTMLFIDNYLIPALDVCGERSWTSEWFVDMVEKELGSSNKLVIYDNEGNTQVFNKQQGVMWEGMWMSNTYAWPYQSMVFGDKPYDYGSSTTNWWDKYFQYDEDEGAVVEGEVVDITAGQELVPVQDDERKRFPYMTYGEIEEWVYNNPSLAAEWIYDKTDMRVH